MLKKHHPKKSKSKVAEDTSWIVEGIVAYLRSPAWTAPVLNFVEEHCGSFTNTEENKFEHTEIHQKYKKVIEKLLAEYMKELEISESQFSEACSRNNRDIARMDSNFEYIWAADDFLLFKRLMLKYNAEVQREMLSMLQQQHDEPHKDDASFTEKDAEVVTKMLKPSKRTLSKEKKLQQLEEEDLHLAIQFSKMEMERLNAMVDEERRLIEQAIRLSLESSSTAQEKYDGAGTKSSPSKSNSSNPDLQLTKPVEIRNRIQLPDGFTASSLDAPPSYQSLAEIKEKKIVQEREKIAEPTSYAADLPPLKTQKQMSNSEAANEWLSNAVKEITESSSSTTGTRDSNKVGSIDPEELAKRKAYLQEQREKLLALKKMERDKELSEYMEQKQAEVSDSGTASEQIDSEEEKKLASRRAVAERLKREVINKK